jgi:hypothetical protein
MTNTFMLERMDKCYDLWVEYLTNVWKLSFSRLNASSGTIYLRVDNADGTMFFKIRIADHPPAQEEKDDPRLVNVDPWKEAVSSLSYACFRYGLRKTSEIEMWNKMNGYGPEANKEKKSKASEPSVGERVALSALMTEVDNLNAKLREAEALNKNYVFETSRLEHDNKKMKESLDAFRASNAKLQAESDSIRAQAKRMSDAYNRFVKEFNG